MKQHLLSIFIVIGLMCFNNCAIFDFFKVFPTSGFVIVVNLAKLELFERNIACYYSRNNKFPLDVNEYKYYEDSTNNRTDLFTKIEIDSVINIYHKYNFEIKPFTIHFEPDSPKTFIDSIYIIHCNGNILFKDSLISDNFDSLIVETNILNIEANVYDKGESIYYNNESGIIKVYISKPFVHKISLNNSCKK